MLPTKKWKLSEAIKPEDIEQIKVVEWLKNRTDLPFFAICNQRNCTPQYGALLKRMGLRAGVSDLMIPRAAKHYYGAFIELKTAKGKLSPHQVVFLEDMMKEGYFAICCWTAEAAITAIKTLYELETPIILENPD